MKVLSKYLVLCLMLLVSHSTMAQTSDKSLRNIENYITSALADWRVPGAAVAIVKDNKVILSRGFGTRTMDKDEPVDGQTLFAIASNSKAFTAAALGLLVEENKINWNDKVSMYLPDFRLYDPLASREIAIRDLLCHRSGLPPYGGDQLWQGSDYSREEILHRIRFQKPTTSFRTHYAYSNVMFLAAGEVIPAVTGQSWEDFIADRFFKPLGMSRSNTDTNDLKSMDNVATPHVEHDGVLKTVEYYRLQNVAPAAAINSCADDLARWMRARLNDGELDGKQIIPAPVLREMRTAQIPLPVSENTQKDFGRHFAAYGLGLSLYDYAGRKVVAHTGLMDGMSSIVTVIPEENIGVAVLTNKSPNTLTRAITMYVLDRLLELPEKDWNAYYIGRRDKSAKKAKTAWQKTQNERIQNTSPSHKLTAYTGEYNDPLSGKAEVKLENGKLAFYHNHKYIADLEHWHYDTFLATWRDPFVADWAGRFVQFRLDVKGNVEALEATFDNPVYFSKQTN